MKFFVPFYQDETKAENFYESIRKHAHDMFGWEMSDRRVYSLKYQHDGKTYRATVGEKDPERNGEPVMVILKSNAYLLCTHNYSVMRGEPALIGLSDVLEVEDFEP